LALKGHFTQRQLIKTHLLSEHGRQLCKFARAKNIVGRFFVFMAQVETFLISKPFHKNLALINLFTDYTLGGLMVIDVFQTALKLWRSSTSRRSGQWTRKATISFLGIQQAGSLRLKWRNSCVKLVTKLPY